MTQEQLQKLAEFFGYLYGRWQDEREYEDFAEYRVALMKKLDGAVVTSFTKSPFRATWVETDGTRRYMQANSKQITWGRLGK